MELVKISRQTVEERKLKAIVVMGCLITSARHKYVNYA